MESRSRASPEQFAALLEFMESHGDIARPQQGAQGRIKAYRLWQELGELLNSIGGGVIKSMDKWQKCGRIGRRKLKKKALSMRREASGTGGGPNSRQTLTASEQRVLGLMGLTAVIGQVGIMERGFDEPPFQRTAAPPQTRNPTNAEFPSQTATDDNVLDLIPSYSIEGNIASTASSTQPPPPSEVSRIPTPEVSTPPPAREPTPIPSATSPNASTSREAQRRRRHPATPSPTVSTPRRQRLLRARTRRVQTPFERATSEFVAVEIRRLQLEEERENNNHQREMESLRLESRRIEMEENRNIILNRLAGSLDTLTEILLNLRPASQVSTDVLPLDS